MKKLLFSVGFLLSVNGLLAMESREDAQLDPNNIAGAVAQELEPLGEANPNIATAMRDHNEEELDADDIVNGGGCMFFGRTHRRVQRCCDKLAQAKAWAVDALRNQYVFRTQGCREKLTNAKVWTLEKLRNAYGVSRDRVEQAYAEMCVVAKDHPALVVMSVIGATATVGAVMYLLGYNAAGEVIGLSKPVAVDCAKGGVCVMHQLVITASDQAQPLGVLVESLKGLGVNYSFHIDFSGLEA